MNPSFYIGALEEATYTMSLAENASFPLANLSDYIPANLWKSSANTNGQTLKIDFGGARARNFCIIHNHNFSGMTTVSLEAADDAAFTVNLVTVVSSLVGSNNSVLKFEFTAVRKRYWRILFTNTNATIPELGQIFIDEKVEQTPMGEGYDFGFRPKNEESESVVSAVALSGLVRTSRIHSGQRLKYEMSWRNVNNRWLEDYRWMRNKLHGNFGWFYFYDHKGERYYVRFEKPFNPAQVSAFKINSSGMETLESQSVGDITYDEQTYPMAISLNGSDEYASKTSPVGLDMGTSDDFTILMELQSNGFVNHGSSNNSVMARGNGFTNAGEWTFYYPSDNFIRFVVNASAITINTTQSVVSSSFNLLALRVQRGVIAELLWDGVVIGSIASALGALNAGTFFLGTDAVGSARSISGKIGRMVIVKGIAIPTADILTFVRYGIPRYEDLEARYAARCYSDYSWKGNTDTKFLKSATGYNNLTGTNVNQAENQVTADYPIVEL